MRVLLTGSNTAFGSALAEHLSALEGCELRLTDRTEQPGDPRTRLPDPFWLSQLDDSEATHALLDGVDQIIHAEPFAAGDMPLEDDAWCDIPSRCTYNLLHAAAEVGVSRVICLSSMAVFNSVDERYVVSANWQAAPRPTPAELGPHLAEFVCREFANSDAIPVAVARLGAPLDPDAVELGERPRFWVATEQAVEEVASLLFEQAPAPEAGDGNSGFFVGGGTANMFHPVVLTPPHLAPPAPPRPKVSSAEGPCAPQHRRIYTISHIVDSEPGGAPPPPVPSVVPPGWAKAPSAGERVVLYGASQRRSRPSESGQALSGCCAAGSDRRQRHDGPADRARAARGLQGSRDRHRLPGGQGPDRATRRRRRSHRFRWRAGHLHRV